MRRVVIRFSNACSCLSSRRWSFCAGVTLIIYNPDWLEMLKGLIPQSYEYPAWLPNEEYPDITKSTVWVETTRYVGVIGGAGFDYMAYTSFVREKRWGMSANPATPAQLEEIAANRRHDVRRWVKAPYVDSTISFLLVVAFSAVFVASGAIILGPNHKIPDEGNMLNLQAEFVTGIHSALLPLYVGGALLTMVGHTLRHSGGSVQHRHRHCLRRQSKVGGETSPPHSPDHDYLVRLRCVGRTELAIRLSAWWCGRPPAFAARHHDAGQLVHGGA